MGHNCVGIVNYSCETLVEKEDFRLVTFFVCCVIVETALFDNFANTSRDSDVNALVTNT